MYRVMQFTNEIVTIHDFQDWESAEFAYLVARDWASNCQVYKVMLLRQFGTNGMNPEWKL